MKKLYIFLLTLLVIFLSLVPRVTDLLSGNYLFSYDQGRDYLAVKSIVVDKKLTLIGSEIGAGMAYFRGIFHGPFHYYFLAVPFILLNGDPYGGIVLTFLYGMLAVIFSFYLGKKLFGLYGGLMVALLVAISPPLISSSRFVWNSHGAVVFILLAFICVYKISFNKKYMGRYIFLAAFFSGFVYNFQLAIAIPMCLALFIYSALILKIKDYKLYLLLFIGFFLAFSPFFLFEIKHDFGALRGITEYSFENKIPLTSKLIERITKERIGLFQYNFLDTFPRVSYINTDVSLVVFIGIYLYLFFLERDIKIKRYLSYLGILPLSHFFILYILRTTAYVYFLIDLNFVYIFLFAYVIVSAYRNKNNFLYFVLIVVFSALVAQGIKSAIKTFQYDYQDYGGIAKIIGKKDLIDFIYKNAKGEKFGVLFFSPPIYTYPYNYIVWWYGSRKYHYVPHQEKKGLFYLAIEPDGSKLWSYNGWLETVIKTGKIIETKTLPSGFIVQKRIGE
ncbi:MAG: hypothetical protein HYV37_02155 [Candidatus Levyibacteriota bacterium]|nr:MAG: hypothetical protein HYV37_02155 [Candidatus Levybacteria bacterium]